MGRLLSFLLWAPRALLARKGRKIRSALVVDWDLQRLEQLLEKSPSYARRDYGNGHTLLHDVAQWANARGTARAVSAAVLLLKHGADPNAIDSRKQTPLGIACADNSHDYALAELFLKHGANPNIKDSRGETAFHWVLLRDNDIRMAELMIAHGADLQLECDHLKLGRPLKIAKGRHPPRPQLIALLEKHGAV